MYSNFYEKLRKNIQKSSKFFLKIQFSKVYLAKFQILTLNLYITYLPVRYTEQNTGG